MYSTTLWLPWSGIGQVPAIVNDAGEVLRLPLLWLVKLAKDGESYSKMRDSAYGLVRFHNFWQHYHLQFKIDHDLAPAGDEYDHEALFRAFWKAMRDGDPNLAWKSVQIGTAKKCFQAVNHFTDWGVEGTGAKHPNPIEVKKLPWFVQVARYCRHLKTDLLAHLLPSLKTDNRFAEERRTNPGQRDAKRHPQGSCRPGKIFALENFHKLIIGEQSPRNCILWLLLGPGGLRISEALHIFVNDILFDSSTQEARIILSDPRYGLIKARILGKEVNLTRQEFLSQKYQLKPRDKLAQNDIKRAGWKGMKMHNPEDKTSEVIWFHPFYGQMLWAAHVQYMKERTASNPQHPWYLVNLDYNVGRPLTRSNARGLLQDACKRLQLPLPHNPHALRHMYGDVAANILKMAIQEVQVGLRHSSILSTLDYTEPSAQTARAAFRTAKGNK